MKKAVLALASVLLLLLPGCGISGRQPLSPAPTTEMESAAMPDPAEILASGCFLYSYSYDDGGNTVTVTVAASDDKSAIMELWEGGGYRAVLRDGACFFTDLNTGAVTELTAGEMGDIIPDYSNLRLVSLQETAGITIREYACTMDGEELALLLQEENGTLTAIDSPESLGTGLCPITDFSDMPPKDIFN